MRNWLAILAKKKERLDRMRSLPQAQEKNLADWLRVELTYTSNAIEGNTLSRQETALVVEKCLTVEGKTLREHQEAINHAAAWELTKNLAREGKKITTGAILEIHRLILNQLDEPSAGRFRRGPVRIAGSRVVLPNAVKVPKLTDKLVNWLTTTKDQPVKVAAEAHYRLVTIHPFVDGNGRTARLVMNLVLLKAGYPAAIIRKEERLKYLNSLEKAQLGGSGDDYYQLIYAAVNRSLDLYLEVAGAKARKTSTKKQRLKIGQLASSSGESISTIRFWTKAGLLPVAGRTRGGYQLYSRDAIKRIKLIRKLQQEKRLTIKEIKKEIS